MKFHRTLAFTALLILVVPLAASIAIQNASNAGKMQGAGQAKSIFGQAWQRFSSGDFQLARNLAGQSKEAAEQTNSTSIPTQMPLPPVTAPAPTASNTTNLVIAAIAIAVIVVAILIWRSRRKKQSKV
jgi:subtilase family serine protease